MKTKKHSKRAEARRPCRALGVSRVRAAAISRARVARMMIRCEVSDVLPVWYRPGYGSRTPPKYCWYVSCGPWETKTTGGTALLLCVSKRSGRVLFTGSMRGE